MPDADTATAVAQGLRSEAIDAKRAEKAERRRAQEARQKLADHLAACTRAGIDVILEGDDPNEVAEISEEVGSQLRDTHSRRRQSGRNGRSS